MKNTLYSYIQKFKSDHRRFRHWTALLFALAVVVVTGVFWRLHDIGIAFTGESVDGTEAVYEGTEFENLAEEVSETDYNSEETDADGNSLTEDETAQQNTEEQNSEESNTEDQNSEETNTEELNTEGANTLELANTESGTEEQENANSLTTGSAAEEYLAAIALLAEQADKLTGTEGEDAWTIYNALLEILDEAEADLAAGNLTEDEYDSIYDALDEVIAGMEALGFDFSQIMTVADDITIEVDESTDVIGLSGGYSSFTLVDFNGSDASGSFTIKYAYAPTTTISSGTSYYVMNYLTSGITGAYFLMNETSSSGMKLNYDSGATWSDSSSYLLTSYAPSSLSQWTFNSSSGRYKMKSGNYYLQQNNTTGITWTTDRDRATEFSVESVSGTSAFYIYRTSGNGNGQTRYALNHYGGEEVAALWESSSAAENEQWYLLSNYGLQLTGLYPGTYYLTMNWTNGGSTTYTITVSGSKSSKVVLNLGNGNGTSSNGDYVDGTSKSGTDALRYTVSISNAFADTDGNVTINLPSDSDLAATTGTTKNFTVVDADTSAGLSAVTVDLSKEQNYDYELVGWINIATGEYYDVSGGSVTATVDTTKNNVFYADWVADESALTYTNNEGLGEDTSSFVKINMFDYNELFNLYSASLSQTGTTSEVWSDSGSFYSDPIVALVENGTYSTAAALDNSFAFQNIKTNSPSGALGYLYGSKTWNDNIDYYSKQNYWTGLGTASTSAILQSLYDTSGSTLGVHYLGSANYLFQINSQGYYYFDADSNGVSYNQEEQRFYLSQSKTTLVDAGYSYGTAFMPLNNIGSYTSISDGKLNYWFGMSVEIEFYLPNSTGTAGGNQWNNSNMMFEFSGDDDVWVFIDDKLVLDLGGIHSEVSGSIDFTTGEVSAKYYSDSATSSVSLGAGTHTLTVYYMERGAWDSNMSMTFNMASLWEYDTTPVSTMEVTKEWSDGEAAHTNDSVTVGLYKRVEITKSEDNGDGTMTYYYDTSETNNGSESFVFEYEKYAVYTGTENLYTPPDVGGVIAYIADEDWNNGNPQYMYVLIDVQTLSADTYNGYTDSRKENWSYAWGQLNYNATFAIRELTGKGGYTSSITSIETISTYQYWSIAGSAELNGTITTETDSQTGKETYSHSGALTNGLKILITDAALYGSETDARPIRYIGYSLVYTNTGELGIEKTYFSSAASAIDTSDAYYSYGVTSDDNNNIPENAYWYVELTGDYRDTTIRVKNGSSYVDMTVKVPTFYLKTADGKYLAVEVLDGANNKYTLKLVDSVNDASAFAYNGNGELESIVTLTGGTEQGVKIVINHETETTTDGEGNTVTTLTDASWGVELRSGETDEDNVKIYIEQDIETAGYSYTITNRPILSMMKVSSEDDGNGNYTALSGAVFALYKLVEEADPTDPNLTITTKYYYSVTPEGIVIWSTEQATLTTDSSGYITLTGIGDGTWYLEEISAPDGYNAIAGTIKMVVENGVIASTTLLDSNGDTITGSESVVSILQLDTADTSDDLTLLVKDTPGVELPSAGGFGKAPYAVFGLLICGSAVLLLYRRRRIAR